MGDNSGDLFTASLYDAFDALLDGGEDHISRENEFVPFPERRSGREWWRAGIGVRWETLGSSIPWGQVWRSTAGVGSGTLRFRFIFSAYGFLDQAIDDFDGLGADFHRFATNHMSLGQS